MVDRYKLWLSRDWVVEMVHIYRKVNKVAIGLLIRRQRNQSMNIFSMPCPRTYCHFFKLICEVSPFRICFLDALDSDFQLSVCLLFTKNNNSNNSHGNHYKPRGGKKATSEAGYRILMLGLEVRQVIVTGGGAFKENP